MFCMYVVVCAAVSDSWLMINVINRIAEWNDACPTLVIPDPGYGLDGLTGKRVRPYRGFIRYNHYIHTAHTAPYMVPVACCAQSASAQCQGARVPGHLTPTRVNPSLG